MEDKDKQLKAVVELTTALEATPLKELVASASFAEQYNALLSLAEYFSSVKSAVNEEIKEIAKSNYYATGESSIVSSDNRFTYVPPTIRETLDSKTLKEENPELYKKYVKVSPVKENFRVTKVKKAGEKPKIPEIEAK